MVGSEPSLAAPRPPGMLQLPPKTNPFAGGKNPRVPLAGGAGLRLN